MAKEIDEAALVERVRKQRAKLLSKKKVVKPTASEKKIIQKRLKKKYPQMSQAGWGKPKKVTKRTKQVSGQLAKAGLTKEEIVRFKKKKDKQIKTPQLSKKQLSYLSDAIEYTKAVEKFAYIIKQDNPGISFDEAIMIANDELSGAYEERIRIRKMRQDIM